MILQNLHLVYHLEDNGVVEHLQICRESMDLVLVIGVEDYYLKLKIRMLKKGSFSFLLFKLIEIC